MSNGLTFKTIHSSTFNLIMKSDNRQSMPNVTRYTVKVPLKQGVTDFGLDTYDEKPLSVKFTYIASSLEDIQIQLEQINGWLYNDGTYYDLIFDDALQRVYKAKVVKSIDPKIQGLTVSFVINFVCNPPHPYGLDNEPITPADIAARLLWDTMDIDGIQYIQTLTADGTVKFTVGGDLAVKPVIKLIGYIANGLKLTYGAYAWQYDEDLVYDGIIIDCVHETVTQMSNGANLYPNVKTYDDYFQLEVGQQSISITGVIGAFPNDLTIALEFTPVYS